MTSLILHAILEDGRPTQKVMNIIDLARDNTTKRITVRRLFQWQPIVDKYGGRSIRIPMITHVRYYQTTSCALFLFAPKSGYEACVACKRRPRNGPATECVHPGGPFGGDTCTNCMYKAKTTSCRRAPQPTVNMKDLTAAAGDIVFPTYSHLFTMAELEKVQFSLSVAINDRLKFIHGDKDTSPAAKRQKIV
ncbi:hypothetical protein V8F06_014027 [Rhypophila decipiens]